MKILNAAHLDEYRARLVNALDPNQPTVTICGGTGCRAYGSEQVLDAARENLKDGQAHVRMTGCHGFCEKGPLMVVHPAGIFYSHVQPKDLPEIVETTIKQGKPVERLSYVHPTGEKITHEHDIPFYARQTRLLLNQNGHLDPTSIDEYITLGGYASLAKALTLTGDQIIGEVSRSGLRGRGGAGFPTGTKWRTAQTEIAKRKAANPQYASGFVACNADEGDPGAYMDRSLMEGNPLRVVEGMTIGAFAVGAVRGYVYIRAEYPLAVHHLALALEQARDLGLLGEDILGSGFNFDIEIRLGAGAFVCGEETALMASIEGKRGEPRPRPPFPAQSWLWEQPTVLNNVKTWASVPIILDKGAEWYASIGTEKSKGTMIFSLVGTVANTGLVEVPMGITLRELIFGIGGGIPNGKKFKAAQIGGPSGGCIPEQHLDTPIDYESLTSLGAIVGSGGLVVANEDTCMVDLARYFMNFVQEESCGKCVPCRVGTLRILELLEKICAGKGEDGDIERLERMARFVNQGSLCALGQTAPNPVLTALRYFRKEYEAHIYDHICTAKVCKGLLTYRIIDTCTGCMVCARNCPAKAITGEKLKLHTIDESLCERCGVCVSVCKFNTIVVETGKVWVNAQVGAGV
ncbi:MAG: NADH-quinone oxidoreductase subunit NuoF [Chloroflexi bacterium]|nr:NADH-quinone oxidoreductase subunit NuoF [Chloroflexota bacterium]